ncbi:hypothetical protein TNCV_3550081 [Trichonephila clavipes]|nr:hypothetical protein TNCV_3550081 [Trichonephila clavipes]
MSSFLVLRGGDNRNRWCDGQVCPDVGQGIIWRLVPDSPVDEKKRKERRERGDRPWIKKREQSPALDGEGMRGEPWLERTGSER